MVCREITLTIAEGENELTPPLSEDRECEATSRPRALCKEASLGLVIKRAVRPTLNRPDDTRDIKIGQWDDWTVHNN